MNKNDKTPTGVETEVSSGVKKKGRPRKHVSDAARKQNYNKRRAAKLHRKYTPKVYYDILPPSQPAPELPIESPKDNPNAWKEYNAKLEICKRKWAEYLKQIGLGMAKGAYAVNAPHGEGELVCGGYDLEAIDAEYQKNEPPE